MNPLIFIKNCKLAPFIPMRCFMLAQASVAIYGTYNLQNALYIVIHINAVNVSEKEAAIASVPKSDYGFYFLNVSCNNVPLRYSFCVKLLLV